MLVVVTQLFDVNLFLSIEIYPAPLTFPTTSVGRAGFLATISWSKITGSKGMSVLQLWKYIACCSMPVAFLGPCLLQLHPQLLAMGHKARLQTRHVHLCQCPCSSLVNALLGENARRWAELGSGLLSDCFLGEWANKLLQNINTECTARS